MIKQLSSLAILSALSACSFGDGGTEPQRFLLKAPEIQSQQQARYSVKVLMPEMAAGLETQRIAVVENTSRLNYYQGYVWAENLPSMLQDVLVDSLQKAGIPTSSDAEGISTTSLLLLDVKEFNTVTSAQGTIVRVRMVAKLVEPASRRVLSTIPLEQELSVAENTIQSTVDSFNKAIGNAINDLIKSLRPKLNGKG